MSWARKIFGPKSPWQAAAATHDAPSISRQSPDHALPHEHESVSEPRFASYRRRRPGETPEWCKLAFKFERRRWSRIKTDWGFVTPLWILMGLVCLIPQVAVLQWAYTVLV